MTTVVKQHKGTTTSGEEYSVLVFKPSTVLKPAIRTNRENFISKKTAPPKRNVQ
ncbi:hypothetical protein SAMN02799624_04922 [Paenibacillus sp. UNC496MF]|nr:hypothetical protein SAMN02799624_04922 [Paenibacillus sp. UNC496MF]